MQNGGKLGVWVGICLLSLAVPAMAVNSDSFDNAGSFTVQSGFPAYGTYGWDNPTPANQVPNVRFDYGTATASSSASIGWSPNDAAGNASSGSLKLSWNWNHATDGDGSAAFTIDLYENSAVTAAMLSMDVMIDPNSAADAYNGYGYFQVFTRNDAYNDDDTSGSADEEFGNPTYGSPASPGAGVWMHFDIPLSGAANSVRAVTIQDYDDANRNINGPATIYIDNLTLTVPEPASAGMLGLCLPALLVRRRK